MNKDVYGVLKEHIYIDLKRYPRTDYCPFCEKQIVKDDECLLLINNYKLFPNIFVHKECFNKYESDEVAIKILSRDYECYKEALEDYKYWHIKEYYE